MTLFVGISLSSVAAAQALSLSVIAIMSIGQLGLWLCPSVRMLQAYASARRGCFAHALKSK